MNENINGIFKEENREEEYFNYIKEIRKQNDEKFKATGYRPKRHIVTHGCQMVILSLFISFVYYL